MNDTAHVDDVKPNVTIVVATYNRAAVLIRALRCVIAQTYTRWTVLVIADSCDDDTEARVAALGDARIRCVNLPERFGEQAGPNSVGMALADTHYVAFLNHDDYWLPDHLATAVACLEVSGADICWTRAAFFNNRGAWDDRVAFDAVSPNGRALSDIYHRKFVVAEPLSSWVVRTDALHRLGPMALASETAMMPIVEYTMRAHRMGLVLEACEAVTVLKDRVWHPPPAYSATADYAEAWVQAIEAGQVDVIRQQIDTDLWLMQQLNGPEDLAAPFVHDGPTPRGTLDAAAGLNLTEMQRHARGHAAPMLSKLLGLRTGQTMTRQPRLDAMIVYARQALK